MKLSIFSNYLNAHMLPLCLELDAMDDVDFAFIALEDHPGNVGRASLNESSYPFLIRGYEESGLEQAAERAVGDDIAVFGHMGEHEDLVKKRMRLGLPTFRSAERLLKRGLVWRFAPPKAWRTHGRFVCYRNQPYYILCVGAYTAYDLSLSGFPRDKLLKWGYFPEPGEVRDAACGPDGPERDPMALLWAARMVDWKGPLETLDAFAQVVRAHPEAHLTMAGDGPEMPRVRQTVAELGLEGSVSLPGFLSPAKLARRMLECGTFLFTSNRKEGWGTALGEAMALGCPVLANVNAGSSPYLVQHCENGLLYDGGVAGLAAGALELMESRELATRLGRCARETMETTWSPRNAAASLVACARAVAAGEPLPAFTGPCETAPILEEGWFAGHRRTTFF